jgi:hypothetical protein
VCGKYTSDKQNSALPANKSSFFSQWQTGGIFTTQIHPEVQFDLKFSANGTHLYHVTILKRATRDPPTCVWFAIYDYFPNHDWFVFTTHSFFFDFSPATTHVRGRQQAGEKKNAAQRPRPTRGTCFEACAKRSPSARGKI